MSEVIAVLIKKPRRSKGSKKLKRSVKDRQSGKYRKQFLRTVKRTGKWRGKKASINDAR